MNGDFILLTTRSFPAAACFAVLLCGFPAEGSAQERVLVEPDSGMRYLVPSSDPGSGTDWVDPHFDDASWTEGHYGVGYNAGGMIRTDVPDGTLAVYTRAVFRVESLDGVESLHLGVDYDDGYVAWVNGVEVARENMPDGAPDFDSQAADDHESSNGDVADFGRILDITDAALPVLVEGENLLAIGVWNDDVASSDLALVPILVMNRPGVSGSEICGVLEGDVTLTAEDSPYDVSCAVTVPAGSVLRIDAGAELRVGAGVEILVEGQIIAAGTAEEPISIGASGGAWDGLRVDLGGSAAPRECRLRHVDFSGGRRLVEVEDTGDSPVLVERCNFDRWTDLALSWDSAPELAIRNCVFGLNTPVSETDTETIKGHGGGALVEFCTFGRRRGYNDVFDLSDTSWDQAVPVVRYNTFLGGEDDAVDYDNCAGWIVGNLIVDFRPPAGASSGPNGGGITGQNSAPIVANNVVVNCYHGIGFKNDSQPLVVGNLVYGCHVGVTFYKDSCGANEPLAALHNNIVWNNRHWETGANQNLVLNGAWWPAYCQTAEDQAAVQVSHSIVEGGWPGEGNVDADPLFAAPESLDFALRLGSPALDAGFGGPLSHAGAASQDIAAALGLDREQRGRIDLPCVDNVGAGTVSHVDIGPLERQSCATEPRFIRGDSNGDRNLDVSDAIHMLLVLFAGLQSYDCDDARDANDDGARDISDAIGLLDHLFRGGAAPPPPYPIPGVDPTEDELGCDREV